MKSNTKYALIGSCALLCLLAAAGALTLYRIYQKTASEDPRVWEDDIVAFEKADAADGHAPEGILFVGSSSFRFWKSLKRDMAPLPVTNRGFGGSRLTALIHYADRIIYPRRPAMVVIYCGDNDMTIGRRRSPGEVLREVQRLTGEIRAHLPEARIYYVSIKPSPSRMEFWPAMMKANWLIAEYMKTQPRMAFIDVSSAMFDADGALKLGIFTWDRIHMNEKGYALWTGIIRPLLARDFAQVRVD
jgi:lysophospholipase L1-like esterase